MNGFEDTGTFTDVSVILSRLASTLKVMPVVFTNGTTDGIEIFNKSKGIAPYSNALRDIAKRKIFITANPFDVNGAYNMRLLCEPI